MKKIILIIAFSALLYIAGCIGNERTQANDAAKQEQENQQQAIETVDAKKFNELISKITGTILDVRTPEEVAHGFIAGAININFFDKEFEQKINALQKDKPVFVYCKAGSRSATAATLMEKNGFTKVYNMENGIEAWKNAGFKTMKH